VIVVDASAALAAVLCDGAARRVLAAERLHVPALIDPEVAAGLESLVAAGNIGAPAGWRALEVWRRLGMARHPVRGLLERVWELRDRLGAQDACYVALAESLGCPLLTADAAIARTSALRCAVTVVPG
jgi:predicted nucleic acid-binding protein